MLFLVVFFFQAEDGIRDLVRSRGLGDVYKRQMTTKLKLLRDQSGRAGAAFILWLLGAPAGIVLLALLVRRLSLIHI